MAAAVCGGAVAWVWAAGVAVVAVAVNAAGCVVGRVALEVPVGVAPEAAAAAASAGVAASAGAVCLAVVELRIELGCELELEPEVILATSVPPKSCVVSIMVSVPTLADLSQSLSNKVCHSVHSEVDHADVQHD